MKTSLLRGLAVILCLLICGMTQVSAGSEPDFMAADKAFVPSAQRLDERHIAVTWQIADGYYLYRHAFKFALTEAGKDQPLGKPVIPDGDKHEDPFFGPVETYRHSVRVLLPISDDQAATSQWQLTVDYQGCADAGLCYPPQTQTLDVAPSEAMDRMPPSSPTTTAATPTASLTLDKPGTSTTDVSSQDQLAARLAHGNPWLSLGLFFLLGIGLAFTPCILPMIPIVSAMVVGTTQGQTPGGRARALGLSSIYVLAMASAYTVFGIVAGYFGANIQAFLQRPVVLLPFAGVFVLLAMASFGWLTLQLPSRWQTQAGQLGTRRTGPVGAALMGFFAALIAGPCLAPPLAGALLFIAASGSLWFGGFALFLLGLGMGLPLIAIAVFGHALLPRRGAWMQEVRVATGVVLIALAIWFATRLAAPVWALAAWGLLAGLYAAYVSTRTAESTAARTCKRAAVGLLSVYAALAAIGLAVGQGRPTAPLAGLRLAPLGTQLASPQATHQGDADSAFQRVTTQHALQQALEQAHANGQPALVDFYADWCVECVQMEHQVFNQPDVRRALDDVAAIQVDVTDYNTEARALMRSVGVFGPPTLLFYAANGEPLNNQRLIGATDKTELLTRLKQVEALSGAPEAAKTNDPASKITDRAAIIANPTKRASSGSDSP